MSESSREIAFFAGLDSVEKVQLLKRVIGLLPVRSLLPPPTNIRLQFSSRRSEGRLEASIVADSLHYGDDSDGVFCEVTDCLDPDIRPSQSVDITSFRAWAISNAEHPLAIRYQPLTAWLLAARCDSRFLTLAHDFILRERVRLQSELMSAATRLLENRRNIRRRA